MSWLVGVVLLVLAVPMLAQVVPAPKRIEVGEAMLRGTSVRCEAAEFAPQVAALVAALEKLGASGVRQSHAAAAADVLVVRRADVGGDDTGEAYRIAPGDGVLVATAATTRGIARATATLLQLARIGNSSVAWPAVTVDDRPDLPFRCFMVDMGRNPHGPAVLRQVVDALWLYKVGYLHLHLCDDQLFSWPSKAFPKLYDERAGWTLADFEALEAYSQARGVTIIPEVDVPGHSTILRRRYPLVFGETPSDLASMPEAQRGVEQLLAEVLSVFRATPYVHVGGDETGVGGDIQRDFMNRLHRWVKAQGRRMLVWEGTSLGEGEHKIDTDVVHVNWHTTAFPAQQMLDAGYEVVNAAWDPFYIVDHYPRTMFTAVPVERCYQWDLRRFAHVDPGMPTFAKPHVTDTADGIIGFCMPWWEGRQENLLSLCVPRLAAVASAAWNRAGERDFAGFEARQVPLLMRFETLAGVQLARLPFADPATQTGNLAYRRKVTPSDGTSQPVFGPARLTNGICERFDHFLGYPTQPEPLEIVVELAAASEIARIVVHETAVGGSYEVYELLVSQDGTSYEQVGMAEQGTRGERSFVEHRFTARPARFVMVRTRGCHGLTFPSFSRLTEIEVFAR